MYNIGMNSVGTNNNTSFGKSLRKVEPKQAMEKALNMCAKIKNSAIPRDTAHSRIETLSLLFSKYTNSEMSTSTFMKKLLKLEKEFNIKA